MSVPMVADQTLVHKFLLLLARPVYFKEVLDCGADYAYRDVLMAWSDIREQNTLQRDEFGRYFLADRAKDLGAP